MGHLPPVKIPTITQVRQGTFPLQTLAVSGTRIREKLPAISIAPSVDAQTSRHDLHVSDLIYRTRTSLRPLALYSPLLEILHPSYIPLQRLALIYAHSLRDSFISHPCPELPNEHASLNDSFNCRGCWRRAGCQATNRQSLLATQAQEVQSMERCRIQQMMFSLTEWLCQCDGATPCSRCKAGDAICVYGKRKESNKTIFQTGWASMLPSLMLGR